MPYRKQMRNGEWTGRYFFYHSLLNKPYRKTVKVAPSMVDRLYQQWKREIIENYGSPHVPQKLFDILNRFLEDAKDSKEKPRYKTYCFMVKLFKDFFGNIKLKDFKSYMIDDYIAWRRKIHLTRKTGIVTDSTINRDLAVLKHFFNYCIEREFYNKCNPVLKKKKLKEHRRFVRLTQSNLKELLDKADGHLRVAIIIALGTGMRRSEILTLKWEYIDLDKSTITIPFQVTKTKTARIALVPIFLKEYLQKLKQNSSSEYVVVFNNKPIRKLRRSWSNLRDKLSFKQLPTGEVLRFHDLRGIYAQSLREIGVQDSDIASACGHSSPSVTMKYYANLPSIGLKDKVNQLKDVYGAIF